MKSTGPKQALYAAFATVARALGNTHRIEILEHLGQGERSVEALAQRTGLSVANASQHLQHLKRAGLVTTRRDGKFVLYRLESDASLALMQALFAAGERNVAAVGDVINGYFHERDSITPVSREELLKCVRRGEATILDTRPVDEYAAGHLPGALNITVGDLEARLAELDPAREIIAYCRGPWCVFSFEAVATLRRHGYRARRLEDGLPQLACRGPADVGRSAV